MTKLKVSYQDTQELEKLIQILKPYILSVKQTKRKNGEYLKAYIQLKETK